MLLLEPSDYLMLKVNEVIFQRNVLIMKNAKQYFKLTLLTKIQVFSVLKQFKAIAQRKAGPKV